MDEQPGSIAESIPNSEHGGVFQQVGGNNMPAFQSAFEEDPDRTKMHTRPCHHGSDGVEGG